VSSCCADGRLFQAVGLAHENERNRAGFKCVEALGRIIVRGPYPPSNAV